MIIANSCKTETYKNLYGLWQWDYGQVLRIQGLDLPTAVEIHFSLQEKGGEAVTRVGTTKDGVTDVAIPDSMLENNGSVVDYFIYAFIYLTDETSGQTEYKISMQVKARPKPEAFDSPEDAELFREAIAAVNAAADRAETAEKEAEGWVHGREDMPEKAEDNAKYYAGEAAKDAEQTSADRKEVEKLVESVDGIDEDVELVRGYKEAAEKAAEGAAASAEKSEESRKASETAKTAAEAAQTKAEEAARKTAEDRTAVEQAKTDVEGMKNQVAEDKTSIEQTVSGFKLTAQQAVTAVNNAGQAQTERVQDTGNTAVQDIQTAKEQAVQSVETAGTEQVQAVQAEGTTQIGAVQQKGREVLDSIPEDFTTQLGTKLDKNQGVKNAGKILGIDSAGNIVPMANLESTIENYYAFRRTGKVYQTKIWKFATNPTSVGEKLLDNAGLAFEPSTDTEEGQDDYLNGQNPLFEWVNVNYIRDADGAPRPTAIEGMGNYKTTGAVDVGTMQMSFWWKWDASNAEYDLITISDTPHPELGLVPWRECVKADGTVLPWCIGSKYISGIASDGLLRSQPGLKPERLQSHNNMITNYQKKGEGYWGAGACRNTFQIIFTLIKGATKSAQTLFSGVTNYSLQYEASVQSAESNTYFPVTNAQAENIPVGCYVSVGYGGNNNGTANNDRGQTTIHAYADDVKVLRKEALDDGANTAIYLDIPEESAFNTQPHVYTETFSAPIMISSMHARAGATDAVRGRHDGSPVSNTDGKHPYRVQGREYAVGGYMVASDTVALLNADGTRTVYAAKPGVAHSSSDDTIKSTYKIAGTIPVNSSGSVADYWVGDDGVDTDTGAWYPRVQGSGNTQGVGDMYYAGGEADNAIREYLQGGDLWNGSHAGSSFLDLRRGIGGGYWYCLGCD